jgi:hypothetical protein
MWIKDGEVVPCPKFVVKMGGIHFMVWRQCADLSAFQVVERERRFIMVIEWDERFDILVGADIRDSEAEPYLDSGVHDLLHGEVGEDAQSSLLISSPIGRHRVFDEGLSQNCLNGV